MTKSPHSVDKEPAYQRAEFMLIKISYDCKLLLPITEGNAFLAAYSRSRHWKDGYKEVTTILPSPPEISVRYITNAEIAKVKFDDMLGLDSDP